VAQRCLTGADQSSPVNSNGTTSLPVAPAAVAAAQRWLPVFPLVPGQKRPAWSGWEQRASRDLDDIRSWPIRTTGYGIACGPAGLIVVDLDMAKDGEQLPPDWVNVIGVHDGADVFAELAERAGASLAEAFETLTVATPSGGTHLFYQAPAGVELHNTARTIGPMIDTRARGGYVVGPGSQTEAGTYRATHLVKPAPLPGWILDLLTKRRQATAGAVAGVPAPRSGSRSAGGPVRQPERYAAGVLARAVAAVESAPSGKRNHTLYAAARNCLEFIQSGHLTEVEVRSELAAAAERRGTNSQSLPGEVQRTIDSGLSAGRLGRAA
jgi:Bifunctional DNA primase/polymerase, N-terminal